MDYSGFEGLSITIIYLYFFSFNFSLGPIVWLYNSEILPEKGFSIATFFNYWGGFILIFVTPYAENYMSVMFGFFSGICLGCYFFISTFLLETRGKSPL